MASDDESVKTRLVSTPPRLSEKERKAKKIELEFVFRSEVRSLKAISRRVITACSDDDSSLVDLEDLNREYNTCLNVVHTRFDELASFCGSLIDPSFASALEKIDDDSLDFVNRIQSSIKAAKSKFSDSKSFAPRIDQSSKFDSDSDEASFKRFLSQMCTQMSLSRLPVPEPEIFTGDPLQYFSWENSFNTLIATRDVPENERIYYLRKYVSGEAKQCIDGFLSLCTPEAYEESLLMLKERYGSDFVMANSFKEKLRNWPRIRHDYFVGLRKFSDYLHQVEIAKHSLHSMHFLDDEQENRSLLLKLPDWCRVRWARKVAEAKAESLNYPGFSKFVKFVKVESDIANDPITCGLSSSSSQSGASSSKSRVSNSTSTQARSFNCLLCEGSHSLQKCDKFIEKSYDDRCAYIRENRLCFGCLIRGHQSNHCRRRLTCDHCG